MIRLFNQQFIKYSINGDEVAPTTGQHHLQGFIRLYNGTSWRSMKKKLGADDVHLEIAVASDAANIRYCSKSRNDIHVLGSVRGQGHRTDLQAVADMLKDKKTIQEIAENQTTSFIKYFKGIERTNEVINPADFKPKPFVSLLYGNPGTGKSYDARYGKDEKTIYTYSAGNGSNNWWNGYNPVQHSTVIIDDMSGSYFTISKLKTLLDVYKINVEVKGGTLPFIPNNIIVTANQCIQHWYNYSNQNDLLALIRKFNVIVKYEGYRYVTVIMSHVMNQMIVRYI